MDGFACVSPLIVSSLEGTVANASFRGGGYGANLAQKPHLGSALSHFFLRDLQNLQAFGAFPRLESGLTACMMNEDEMKTANVG